MENESAVAVQRHRKSGRIQIRRKQLFMIQAALAVPLALVVLMWQLMERTRVAQAERERQLQALESVGWAKDDDGEIRILLSNPKCTDEDLGLLLPFADELVELRLNNTAITDDAGKVISKLHRLRVLDVSNTAVGIDLCRRISTLRELHSVNMVRCRMNGGAKYLRRLPLAYLVVFDSDLDDLGLQELCEIKTLKNLSVQRTKVSARAIEVFQNARPDVALTH